MTVVHIEAEPGIRFQSLAGVAGSYADGTMRLAVAIPRGRAVIVTCRDTGANALTTSQEAGSVTVDDAPYEMFTVRLSSTNVRLAYLERLQ